MPHTERDLQLPRTLKGTILASQRPGIRGMSVYAWQDRIRDPSLTMLLVLELCAIFLAAPLAAKGLPVARAVADMLLLAVLVIVVLLSKRWGAIFLILLGLAVSGASYLPSGDWSWVSIAVFRRR